MEKARYLIDATKESRNLLRKSRTYFEVFSTERFVRSIDLKKFWGLLSPGKQKFLLRLALEQSQIYILKEGGELVVSPTTLGKEVLDYCATNLDVVLDPDTVAVSGDPVEKPVVKA